MQVQSEAEMAELISSCLPELEGIEEEFIRGHYLQEPRESLSEFAQRRHLSKEAMDGLRRHIVFRMKELLAQKQIYSMGDIL